ncbi:MAG: FkbM family methyltransferase [Deltaproteobacteria bacterium]|nr:FkbM family methyltransferase [Deltaproteobacteria bacterium]
MNATDSIKELLKRIARRCGFVVQRYDPRHPPSRCSLQSSMRVAHAIGFAPETVIDVGAARGCWSAEVSTIWPESHYILIDPLEENQDDLKSVGKKLKHSDYRIAAMTDRSGNLTLNVHADLEGSSIFLEREDGINGMPREIESLTVDDLVSDMGLRPPILLKADVQGAEMQVIMGAKRTLPIVEMIILEVLLFDIYQGENPQLFDTVSYLKSNGFVTWDIFGMGYRMLDDALCQVDMVFVREGGLFREFHQYANRDQRQEQLAAIKRDNPKRLNQR